MKTSLKSTAVLLLLFAVASALALPPTKQPHPLKQQSAATKEDAPCAICARLAKENPPHTATIGGRVYDLNRTCHRHPRYTPRANGKGHQYTTECVCV